MDSGHSGSQQSSSDGDEEYYSRAADSLSSLLNQQRPPQNPQHPPPPSPHHLATPLCDPLCNYFNLDSAWANTPRSGSTCTDFNSLFTPFSLPVPHSDCPGTVTVSTEPAPSSSSAAPQVHVAPAGARNPRKRSRASRRAPTTVLTTDTTNFRAMVQEFTGIPAPPFPSSSQFARAKLNLFCAPETIRSRPSSDPPPFLLRPFAQKFQPAVSPSLLPTSSQDQSQGSSINLRNDQNDPVLTFRSNHLVKSGFNMNQNQLTGMPTFVSSDGNLDILHVDSEKGPRNVATRTEGLVEPWLCSSDNR